MINGPLNQINRFVLARNSSIFEGMFSLPDTETVQGSCDEDPIVLYDDPEDFRALCWALYAS